jgi:UDP-N-acetylmuramoyl-L-alanyl-D-glutamate--2,6-diaminopimelate ligase
MNLKELIRDISLVKQEGLLEIEVEGLSLDSRTVKNGFLYAAIPGVNADGHEYIAQAIKNGARAILCEELPNALKKEVCYLKVESTSKSLGPIASKFYGEPSRYIKVIAITGTNGKTTCVSLLHDLFTSLGYTCGLLSTVNIKVGEKVLPSTHTTPNSIAIQKHLAMMLEAGCSYCFMEASSHAIVQDRLAGLNISVAGFTNLSHDHLDYHKTFKEYRDAKKLLFDNLNPDSACISNKDDKNGSYMLQNTSASKYYYALKHKADFSSRIIEMDIAGLLLNINNHEAWYPITGEFNAYNLTLIYGIAFLLNQKEEEVITHLSKVGKVPGRFEIIQSKKEKITGIVDYAHTPDALENILVSINKIRTKNEKLITVFGCGGNRDNEKRPKMGKIAAQLSDQIIITSDNPRSESPEDIIDAIASGVEAPNIKKVLQITDRAQAIQTAIQLAEPKDIILIAGKGHEKFQEINGVKNPFNDLELLYTGFNQFQK